MYFTKRISDSIYALDNLGQDYLELDFNAAFAAPNSILPVSAAPQPGPVFAPPVNSYDVTDLLIANGGNGSEGFVVTNINPGAFQLPGIKSLGDVNNDGIDDFAIGDPSAAGLAGLTYVIFGSTTPFGAEFDVSTLNGTNGFVLEGVFSYTHPMNGQYGDRSGWDVAGADVNGDGINDIIIGAPTADENNSPTYVDQSQPGGQTYVVFGQDTSITPFAANFQLSTLNGTNGFSMTNFQHGTQAGISVGAIGDINNDGIEDFAIGAPYADEPGTGTEGWLNGLTYIVFGSTTPFSATFDITTLNGTNGFVATAFSNNAFQYSGTSVEAAGDINNDGIDDFVIGAPGSDLNGDAGKSFVVFGTATPFSATFDLNSLNGTNGFQIEGNFVGAAMGASASSGDFNGDGIDDLLLGGGGGGDFGTGFNSEGQSVVIFGSSSPFTASLDSSTFTGAEGFVINGIDFAEQTGLTVSSAGDVNGDGFDDILIGAGGGPSNDSDSYFIFGSASGHGGALDLDALPASVGLLLDGAHQVTDIGDINSDGFDDFMVADNFTPYVVLGSATFGSPAMMPLLGAFDSSGVVYVEHDGPTVIEGGITFSDPDSANFTGATVSIVGGLDSTNDVLGFIPQSGITGSYSAATGILTLTGSATIADYNTALQSITYENQFVTNSTAARDISFTVTDGVTTSAAATRQFTFVINESIVGTAGADVLNGDWGNDTIDGGAGADVINGGVGADTILGGAGADQNDGGADFDTIDYRLAASAVHFDMTATGTLGDANGDTYANFERAYGSNFNDVFTGTAANEFLHGEGGNDIINGGDGIDRIYGGDGNDVQRGQGGNDLLYGSSGADQLNGGIGFDIVSYEFSAAAVNVNMQTGGTGGDAAGDTYFGTEAVYGSDFDDILTGASGTNELRGGLGNDIIDGSGGNDRLFGDAGADTLIGGTGLDGAYYTNAGSAVTADLVNGGSVGDAAGDTYNSIEWVFGSNFDDTLLGDGIANRLTGGQGADTLDGRGGNDRLLGGDGNDTINGGAGVDSIFGQDGDDVMFGGADNDFFYGGAGIDSHDGGTGFDSISYLASSSGVFVDVVSGGDSGDANGDTYVSIERYFGSNFDDVVLGSAANETIYGYGGADALYGRQGNDSIFGGAGEDSFGYDPSSDGADVINDFVAGALANEYIFIFGGDPNIDTFAEVMSFASNSSGNTVFNFGGGNILTVIGVATTDFTSDDFDFTETVAPQEPLDPGDYYGQDYNPADNDSADVNAFFDFLEIG
ncbi:MAG: hypothetical protein ABJN69_04525 [Hellea sp.]